jgi:hypothetical protein
MVSSQNEKDVEEELEGGASECPPQCLEKILHGQRTPDKIRKLDSRSAGRSCGENVSDMMVSDPPGSDTVAPAPVAE